MNRSGSGRSVDALLCAMTGKVNLQGKEHFNGGGVRFGPRVRKAVIVVNFVCVCVLLKCNLFYVNLRTPKGRPPFQGSLFCL